MKRVLFVVFAVLAAIFTAGMAGAEPQKFDGGRYGVKGELWLVEEMKGNVNGDEFEDLVCLVARLDEPGNRIEQMWLEVQHGFAETTPADKRPAPYLIPLPENLVGYNPRVKMAKFVGQWNCDEVFLTFDALPDARRCFAVILIRPSDIHRDAIFLFDSRTMNNAIVSGGYIGKYMVKIRITDTNTNFTLDVSDRKGFYEENGLYDKQGDILFPLAVKITRYDDIVIGPRGVDGLDTLVAPLSIYGLGDSDKLATVNCTLQYDHQFASWRVESTEVFPEPGIVEVNN